MNSNEELNSYVCMTQDPTNSFLTVTAHVCLTEWFVCSENSKKKKIAKYRLLSCITCQNPRFYNNMSESMTHKNRYQRIPEL